MYDTRVAKFEQEIEKVVYANSDVVPYYKRILNFKEFSVYTHTDSNGAEKIINAYYEYLDKPNTSGVTFELTAEMNSVTFTIEFKYDYHISKYRIDVWE